ncbi:tetratricopeptide repeat protein [Nonomuraea sp. NPDC049480]|uniref:tetratricopeptide repeat protein n=1 Tax=Nonomuraea sp. NPDC049480 TaxID=3364353 RepID=UPI003788BE98
MDRTLPGAVAAALAAGLTLASGCADGSSPEMTPRPGRPVVKPVKSIVPREGGGDVPDPTAMVCRECQSGLEKGKYAELDRKMDPIASARAGSALSGAAPASTKAVALVCAGAAKTNLGRYAEALKTLDAAENVRGDLPAEVRPQLLELLYHAQLISAAAVGDYDTARDAVTHLTEVGGKPGGYVKEACEVAPDGAALPECASVTSPPIGPGSPSGEPPPPTPGPGSPDITPGSPAPEPVSPDVDSESPVPDPDEGPPSPEDGPPSPDEEPPDTDGDDPAPPPVES